MMHPITMEVCQRLNKYIDRQLRAPPKDGIDAKDVSLNDRIQIFLFKQQFFLKLCSRYMADILADAVLGLQSDSFSEIEGCSPILQMQNEMFEYSPTYHTLMGLFPSITKIYKKRFITKKFEKYFIQLMQKSIDLRKSLNAEDRADFLAYMMKMQDKNGLTTKEIAAHAMTFLLDGFETVSTILAHCLLLVSLIALKLLNKIDFSIFF